MTTGTTAGSRSGAIGMVEVERNGRVIRTRRCSLSAAPLTAMLFARAARAHCGVENRLHRIMDVVFHDDLMRLRTLDEPANMVTVRHMAIDLLKTAPDQTASP